ncbi:hypothetical protein ACHAWF_005420 [Thalassiosira exigua]
MQPLLVTAGYIRPGAKLGRDMLGLIDSNKDRWPLDISFSIDPSPNAQAAATCPLDEVRWDTTIVRPPPDSDPADAISTVAANANQHLQRYERVS